MEWLGEHFQDMLVSTEYRCQEKLLNRVCCYQFIQYVLFQIPLESVQWHRILSSLVDYSKPLHLSRQTLSDPFLDIKIASTIELISCCGYECLHNLQTFVLCAQVQGHSWFYILGIVNRILSSEKYWATPAPSREEHGQHPHNWFWSQF